MIIAMIAVSVTASIADIAIVMIAGEDAIEIAPVILIKIFLNSRLTMKVGLLSINADASIIDFIFKPLPFKCLGSRFCL